MQCPDCEVIDRRQFLKTAAAASAGALGAVAAPRFKGSSETLVTTLYQSLSAEQKKTVVFPFDHPLRSKVDANWQITPAKIGTAFTSDQQAMIEEIFRGLHNPEFLDKVLYHIKEDGGGIGNYSVALFGEPGSGAFEFVLTGRHCTARCDGDSVDRGRIRGPDLLRARIAKLQRKTGSSPECLLVSGAPGQSGVSGAGWKAAATGSARRSARGEVEPIPLR